MVYINYSLFCGFCAVLSLSVVSDSFDPTDPSLSGSSVHGDSPGKDAGVGCHVLLQGIFPTQGSNPGLLHWGLSDSSVSKESACNPGDPGSIPGSGRSAAERIGSPLPYCWASLVAQLVKNPPEMWETWDKSLGWDDPLEKGKATHSSSLAWRIPWNV